jgi:pimeloyl-ACP methyl ester carboxylesterase
VRYAAHGEPRRADAPAIGRDRSRRRYQRELVGLAIAELEIVRGAALRAGGDLDRDNQVAATERVITLRRIAGQAVEVGERDRSFARAPTHQDRRIHGCKCHRYVGRIGGDAGVGPSEDRVVAIEAAAGSGPLAAELICDWGFGPAGHIGGHKAPGSWMMGHGLRLLHRSAGAVLHTDLAACNAYRSGLEAAARLRCPTLVMSGEFDRMTPPRHAAELAEAIKGATFIALPAAGHMLMVEQPDATLDALVEFAHIT